MKRNTGKLVVICGSMFSGKSEELMFRLRRAGYAKKKVLTIKHQIDTRKSFACIVSHNGEKREANSIGNCSDGMHALIEMVDDTIDVIGIDEIQFFPPAVIPIFQQFVNEGKQVIVAGLDMNFRGEPFGIVPTLMAIADEVIKLRAICISCGNEANLSQRLINGVPARYDDPTILVGGEESYEARCRHCFTCEGAQSDQAAQRTTESLCV